MKRALFVLAVITCVVVLGQRRGGRGGAMQTETPSVPKTDFEKKILASIDAIFRSGATYANVPAADGRMLRLLAETAGAKNVVEIGTSTGISGLWFSLALERTGGKLTTFEYDAERAATARKHFQAAGVDRLITIVQGDAHQTISRLQAPIDIVFLDADKEGYVDYLQKLKPLVRPGGLLLAHNVDMVPEYMKAVTSDPDLDTTVFTGGGGLAITLKKR